MSIYSDKARELFENGYNCSQAVLAAFSDVTGLDEKTSLLIASSFGGGMGRMREVCGAVSGMFMAVGLICGYADPNDKTAKAEHYRLVRELADEFKRENGSIICRELLGVEKAPESHVPQERTSEYYAKRPCAELVEQAAQILSSYLEQSGTVR